MPCRDDWDYGSNTFDVAKARADKLAAEACKWRQLIYEIANYIDAGDVPPPISKGISEAIAAQRKHREKDRECARQEVIGERRKAEQNIATIKKLGGTPNKKLLKGVEKFKQQELEILQADPMHTDLY